MKRPVIVTDVDIDDPPGVACSPSLRNPDHWWADVIIRIDVGARGRDGSAIYEELKGKTCECRKGCNNTWNIPAIRRQFNSKDDLLNYMNKRPPVDGTPYTV